MASGEFLNMSNQCPNSADKENFCRLDEVVGLLDRIREIISKIKPKANLENKSFKELPEYLQDIFKDFEERENRLKEIIKNYVRHLPGCIQISSTSGEPICLCGLKRELTELENDLD